MQIRVAFWLFLALCLNWSPLAGANQFRAPEAIGPSSRKTPIAISEIMYKPAPRTDGRNLEFLEIYNSNPYFQDIGGYQITGGDISYTFPKGTKLGALSYLVIAASPVDLQTIYGVTNVLGPYLGNLKKTGTVELDDEFGSVLLTVPYSNIEPWLVGADGAGHSLVLARPSYGEEDPRAWGLSDRMGGSPGLAETNTFTPLGVLRINEVLAHSESPAVQPFVELYNQTNRVTDLSACILTDDPATNKFVIPTNTVVAAGGFVSFTQSQLGFSLNGAGGIIYLIQPDGQRVLDAITYEAQADGISLGRWPDGANDFYPCAARTPGTNNSTVLIRDIVINELMYDPISGNDDDQYLELYNAGTNTISLANWQLNGGVSFTFGSASFLAPDGYLVVARNQTNLWARYANLNNTNTVGNFSGRLSHNGERVTLTMPQALVTTSVSGPVTNTIYVVMDEVTYGVGGRWGQWAAGGGSSLELMDPRSNHRLALNWGDSDETHKSAWVNIEKTGVLDNGANYDSRIDYCQFGILDVGECLVDSLEVRLGTTGTNCVLNPEFESGLTSWTTQGCHYRSGLENEGYASGHSLHVRSSDRFWTGVNSCVGALGVNGLASGQTGTLRFKARWLRGWPEVLMRVSGNWLEATGPLPVPTNLGTPGARNSRYLTNAGPAIYEVTHNPPIPAASQAVVVSARVHDPDGLKSLTLNYRVDPSTTYTNVVMKDDGTGGDVLAGDGIFSATIPGQASKKVAAFILTAVDKRSVTNVFPSIIKDNAPVRECVVLFGDGNPALQFGVYHLWLTATNVSRWSALSSLSNEAHDSTMVNGNRIIYNAQGRFAGSPFHQTFNSPTGNLCHYKWIFPDDDKFLGATSFNKIHQPGNGAGDDTSLQREQLAHTFLRALGVPWLNRRYVAVYVNGNRRGTLMEDAQCPDGDVVKEHFPNDTGGFLYKMQPWFEFGPVPSGQSIAFANEAWCSLNAYNTSGGVKKLARYRYNWEIRRTADSASNFTNVFSLVAAAASAGTANYVANLTNIADMENWMRVFAANHSAGNWDSFGAQNEQNLYGYIGTQGTRYSLLMWDFNIVFGNSGSWGPGQNLFTVSSADPFMTAIYNQGEFRRMYYRALQELVAGPLASTNSSPLLDAKYAAFTNNGMTTVESPATSIKSWLSSAQASIASTVAAANAAFTVSPNVTYANDLATLTGTAPFNVKTLLINGVAWPLTWTTSTAWKISLPLVPGSIVLSVTGLDLRGQPVAGASNGVTAVFNGTAISPVGWVVINELMPSPPVPGAAYVELFNRSSNYAFDLSGWRLEGLNYNFPAGTVLPANSYLVLTENRATFASTYGATRPVFDIFTGTLQPAGERLKLVQPGLAGAPDVIVAQVRYSSAAPWPTVAPGQALALLDPAQDNWRVGNWHAATPSPYAANPGMVSLPSFPSLWINELQAVNLTGITNGAGQRTPWLEVYNPTTNTVSLADVVLANNYTNLAQFAFPSDATVASGQFLVVFADGLTNLSQPAELHAGFVLSNGVGSVALSRLYSGTPQILDFVDYSGLAANHSFGSYPDGQSFDRQEFFFATPAATNNGHSAPLSVVINEWMASNTHTLADPQDGGQFDDWFELYNYGTNAADLAGYFLTDSVTNWSKFLIPTGYVIPPHGFLLVWADKKSTVGSPTLHTNFRLSKSGSTIGLFGADGNPVDTVSFGSQSPDISQGRAPDGGGTIIFMASASPATNNVIPNSPPSLEAIPDVVVTLGQTLSVRAIASDRDLPAQSLTFSLGEGFPTGAFINPLSGQLSWTPVAVSATNRFTVAVSDNGIPSLSAFRTFNAKVVDRPQFAQAILGSDQITLLWPTVPGQNCQVEYTGDLLSASWVPLGLPVNGSGDTASVLDTPSTSDQRFYRLRVVGP